MRFALVTLFLLSLPRFAWGAEKVPPRTSSLSWIRLSGAEDCVSTQDLARDVEARLRRSVFVSAAQADVSVEGHIEPKGSGKGWNATIALRDAKGTLLGTRELRRDDPSSCAELREPLALIVAVMIDPDAALGGEGQRHETAPREPVVIANPQHDAAEVLPPRPTPAPPQWKFDGGASLIAGLGLLPNAGLGVYGGGLLEPPHLIPLQGFGAVWLDNTASTEGPGRATFSLMFLGGGLCPLTWRTSRVSAYGCANGHLGLIKSHGEGFDVPASDERKPYLAGALEGRVSIRLFGPIALRAAVSVAAPLLRDTFEYRRADGTSAKLFQMAPVVGTADFGFGVVIP